MTAWLRTWAEKIVTRLLVKKPLTLYWNFFIALQELTAFTSHLADLGVNSTVTLNVVRHKYDQKSGFNLNRYGENPDGVTAIFH